VLEIVLAQEVAIEELQKEVETLSVTTLARTVEKMSARLGQLEAARVYGLSEVRGRLLAVEVPIIRAYHSGAGQAS
jgi:hypothetical protein